MVVVPCQLTVGDYVLTPQICVERKSVSDLISSFKNGRLFNQAETMLQYYKYPFLLIEFDHNKSFTLDPFADLHSISTLKMPDSETKDLQSKLVLLTLAFPRLKIIWSSSPFQTAEIFEELKKQQEEPDPLRAVQIGLNINDGDEGGGGSGVGGGMVLNPEERTFNTLPQELLRTIPGVTGKNAARLYLEARNVLEVANMSVDELEPLVGREAGRQIVRFFEKNVFEEEGG
jgi:DNA excision repair protein ERCC-4